MKTCFTSALKSNAGKELFGMSTTRYKIRLWEYDGEASVANAVTFDSFEEAKARFNDLRVSEEMPCVEFIKERIANGCIISDEVLNVRQFASVFDANLFRHVRRDIGAEDHSGKQSSRESGCENLFRRKPCFLRLFPRSHRQRAFRKARRDYLRRNGCRGGERR